MQTAVVTKLKLRGLFLLRACVVVEKTDAPNVKRDTHPAHCDLYFLHTLFACIMEFSFLKFFYLFCYYPLCFEHNLNYQDASVFCPAFFLLLSFHAFFLS